MGGFSPQVQSPQSSGKGSGPMPFDMQKNTENFLTGLAGGKVTTPEAGGQPQMGVPNAYENTVQPYNQQQFQPTIGKGGPANSQLAQKTIGKGV